MAQRRGRLEGKVVLISGTGGGQGRVAARLFAQEGARVAGCDINAQTAAETAEMVRAEGLEMISEEQSVDLADPAQAKAWVQRVVDHYGGIDVLYNNASLPRFGPFPDISEEDYRFTIRNEVDVPWFSAQAAWPHLVARGGGAIVNIASLAGIVGLRDLGNSAHSAAKGAVIGMTAQLAAEGAAVGIRVNCISPGVIDAPPVRELLASSANSPLQAMVDATAFGRFGDPEDIVYAALYFASDEAKWVTGSHLLVDGGAAVLI